MRSNNNSLNHNQIMSLTQSLALTTTIESDNDPIDNNKNDKQEVAQSSQLPQTKGFLGTSSLYQTFWCPTRVLPNIVSFQTHFQAQPQDIIIASHPKSGTTWLKALVYSIVNRAHVAPSDTPLLAHNPHQLVPFCEFTLYAGAKAPEPRVSLCPRLLATHVPYASLPKSIKGSGCRIVYICRNPLDVVVSYWHFGVGDNPERQSQWTMEDYVDKFCLGEYGFGPFWCHVLGSWKASLEKPEEVLFVRYEEMKRESLIQVKRIAKFLGFSFTEKEEREGVIKQIIDLCSFENLKNLEVNKSGKFMPNFENKCYFRKGEVDDWVNYLSPSMAERINKVVEDKLSGSGLTFMK